MYAVHSKEFKTYRQEIDIQMPAHVYGRELRVIKAICLRLKNEFSNHGITIDPWIDTREVPGKAVIYSDKAFVVKRIIKELRKREEYIVKRQNYYKQNPTTKMIQDEMDEVMDVMMNDSSNNKFTMEDAEIMDQWEHIQEEMDIWQIMTKWGNEHTLPLYNETENPCGVYLCTNELKIGEVFTIPCQIFA